MCTFEYGRNTETEREKKNLRNCVGLLENLKKYRRNKFRCDTQIMHYNQERGDTREGKPGRKTFVARNDREFWARMLLCSVWKFDNPPGFVLKQDGPFNPLDTSSTSLKSNCNFYVRLFAQFIVHENKCSREYKWNYLSNRWRNCPCYYTHICSQYLPKYSEELKTDRLNFCVVWSNGTGSYTNR